METPIEARDNLLTAETAITELLLRLSVNDPMYRVLAGIQLKLSGLIRQNECLKFHGPRP